MFLTSLLRICNVRYSYILEVQLLIWAIEYVVVIYI